MEEDQACDVLGTFDGAPKSTSYVRGGGAGRRYVPPPSVREAADQYGQYRRDKIKDPSIAEPTSAARLKAA